MFVLVVIFVILFIAVRQVIARSGMFEGSNSHVVAFCVSLLSVIGLNRFFLPTTKEGDGFDFILLPYVALAVSILTTLFLMKMFRTKKSKNREYGQEKRRSAKKILKDQDQPRHVHNTSSDMRKM
jgi:uncharacterized membrane protein